MTTRKTSATDTTNSEKLTNNSPNDSDDSGQLAKFLDDVEELTRLVAHVEEEDVARVRQRIEDSLDSMKKDVGKRLDRAVSSSAAVAKAADEYVHVHPWNAVGVTALPCLALGAVLRAR